VRCSVVYPGCWCELLELDVELVELERLLDFVDVDDVLLELLDFVDVDEELLDFADDDDVLLEVLDFADDDDVLLELLDFPDEMLLEPLEVVHDTAELAMLDTLVDLELVLEVEVLDELLMPDDEFVDVVETYGGIA
jgi:hypothetical protein